MGNRLRSTLTGILYARLTGRRLLIDWSDFTYSPDGSNVFHRYFRCPSSTEASEPQTTRSVNPTIWVDRLHDSVANIQRDYRNLRPAKFLRVSSIDVARLDYEEDVLVLWSFTDGVNLLRRHFEGDLRELRHANADVVLRSVLDGSLELHPRIRTEVDRFKSDFFGERVVGVHVRWADLRVRLPAILDGLSELVDRDPSLQVFLATDNSEIKNLFEETYPRLITTPHWYPKPGDHVHQNRACPDRFENGVEALRDLYLLGECDALVLDTTSSFAYLAKLLSRAPASAIVDARPRLLSRERLRHRLSVVRRGAWR
jgi:hypothetical protein